MLTVKLLSTIYTIWLFYRLGMEWRHVKDMHKRIRGGRSYK